MLKDLKYLFGYSIPLAAIIGILYPDYFAYLTPLYGFGLLPLIELFTKPKASNDIEKLQIKKSKSKFYDFMLYLSVPIQYTVIFLLVSELSKGGQSVLGINAAHELGHRVTPHERFMAKALLLTSLYMHFIIEHNRGHHKHVSTPKDPATARFGESLYRFIIRSVVQSFISAWLIEMRRLQKNNKVVWSISNEMIRFIFIQFSFMLLIYFFFGGLATFGFILAAIYGFILLEIINYIEHYGLMRKEISPGKYETVRPEHSWNSDFVIGRITLFELTRHSDHHYKASRKYQVLRYFEDSPQLPTGYPGMMLLSTIPTLWFKLMNKRVEKLKF